MVSLFTPERALPAALGAGVFAAGLLASLLGAPHHAHAATGCRSDPIVVLSNGTVLDLSAAIGADVSTVAQIGYTLHAPAGSTIARVVSTDGDVQYNEQFTLRTDNPAGCYTMQVQVAMRPLPVGTPLPSVTGTLAGGAATTLGVTPQMVGLAAWTGTATATTKAPPPPPQGTTTLFTLPTTMSAWVITWAANAPWAVTATTPTGQSGQSLAASVTL